MERLKRKQKSAAEAEQLTQAPVVTPERVKIDEVLKMLPCTDNIGRDYWARVVSAIHACTAGSKEGFQIADEWCRGWIFYNSDDLRKRWQACGEFPPEGINSTTLFAMADKKREQEEEQAKAKHERDARIAELAKVKKRSAVDYDLERKKAAEEFDVRASSIDADVDRFCSEPPPEEEKVVDIEQLKASAAAIIASENVLDLFSKDVQSRLAGEVKNAKLLYLAATTRLFDKGMHAVAKGLSAIGKSWLLDCVLAYIPPEDTVPFTTLTEKALVYLPNNLSHKIFRMAEAAGSKEHELQDYLIREIITTGRIVHLAAWKDGDVGRPVTRPIVVEGPITFMTTTTKARLHTEIETRILTMETDDSERQTGRVLVKIAETEGEGNNDITDLAPWHDFQRWLAAGECRVVIPYARPLARLTVARVVRMRRDFSQTLRAIKAHALVHRDHRERDEKGRIIATVKEDYDAIYNLMSFMLALSSETKVGKSMATIIDAVKELQPLDDSREVPGVTVNKVAERLKLDRTTVWRRLQRAEHAGYLENLAQRGATGRYRIARRRPKVTDVLPPPEELEEELGKGEE